MAYSTPHDARTYLFGVALFICHDFKLQCMRRSKKAKKDLLSETREIDLCARMASFFGPSAHLAAQGTDNVDLQIDGPTIRTEVKYFKKAQQFVGKLRKDWDRPLAISNTNSEFSKRAWVVFWPSTKSFTFTNCLSVPKSHGAQYSYADYAPFLPYAEPELPPHGNNQRLKFRAPPRSSLVVIPGGKKVRVDIVGRISDPLWCAIYTRVVGATGIPQADHFRTDDAPIQLP